MGHGHVTPNPDGSVARCGGPKFCRTCQFELGILRATEAQKAAIMLEHDTSAQKQEAMDWLLGSTHTAEALPYRYMYIFSVGYVVYKDDDAVRDKESLTVSARVAVFVDQMPAADYCCYRNGIAKTRPDVPFYGRFTTAEMQAVHQKG